MRLAEVIEWHERGLLPLGEKLTADPRCRFAAAISSRCRHPPMALIASTGPPLRSVLMDIDHSPQRPAASEPRRHCTGEVYKTSRASATRRCVRVWSNDPPEQAFMTALASAFATSDAHVVPSTTLFKIETRATPFTSASRPASPVKRACHAGDAKQKNRATGGSALAHLGLRARHWWERFRRSSAWKFNTSSAALRRLDFRWSGGSALAQQKTSRSVPIYLLSGQRRQRRRPRQAAIETAVDIINNGILVLATCR